MRNVYHLFADKFCDLPHIENGKIAPYYYNFKGYYFPMRKDKKLSYSCVAGYTTETGTQEGRITCTAKGWSPVPRCYSELALLSSLLFLVGNFSSSISLSIQGQKLKNRRDKMHVRTRLNILCIQTTF